MLRAGRASIRDKLPILRFGCYLCVQSCNTTFSRELCTLRPSLL